jgi:uncharacterized iron-regulated membrane protein
MATISSGNDAEARKARPGRAFLTRALFLTHRYLGIGIGLLVAAWCLSGIVMMYVAYPELTPAERLRGLAPVDFTGCCRLPANLAEDDAPVSRLVIESRAGRPVAYIDTGAMSSRNGAIDLLTGDVSTGIDEAAAFAVASDFAAHRGLIGGIRGVTEVIRDQWTVTGAFEPDRPLYKVSFNDKAKTELYIASTTGRVVQKTTGRERFWNVFGAVTHWIYPTMLRQNAALWNEVVVWTSLIGTFLTITGLYAGIRQFRRGKRLSPYRGFALWHHLMGLVFGLFTLTWVVSGLLSMNPWGLLEGSSAQNERYALEGDAPHWGAVKAMLASLPEKAPDGMVQLESAWFEGKPYFLAHTEDGGTTRLDGTFAPHPLDRQTLAEAARHLRASPVAALDFIDHEDAYYFEPHGGALLPVLRVRYADPGDTRYYLDPQSGRLIAKVDRDRRLFRWLQLGLHRLDFTPELRTRPLWDIVTLLLMLGVTAGALTGCWMGIKRVTGTGKRRSGQPSRRSFRRLR